MLPRLKRLTQSTEPVDTEAARTEPVDEAVLRTEWVGSPVIGESVDTEPVDEAAPGVHDPPEQTMSEAEL